MARQDLPGMAKLRHELWELYYDLRRLRCAQQRAAFRFGTISP
jgi:hypothetical protein